MTPPGPCQSGPERVAKALFRDLPNMFRMHAGRRPRMRAKNAPVAQLDRALDYESRGQEFESLRARHFARLGAPKPAAFALEAAMSVRSSSPFEPMMRSSWIALAVCVLPLDHA